MLYSSSPYSLPPSSSKNHTLSVPESLQKASNVITLLTNARCHLHTLLINHNLGLFRDGFPFRCVHRFDSTAAEGRYHVSYEPYEINEEVVVPSDAGHTRVLVTLSYARPLATMTQPQDKFFTWTLYISAPADHRISRTSSLGRNPSSQRTSIAQVLVDPTILNPSSHHIFGQLIVRNPTVLSRALSMSLESGEAITILPSPTRITTPYSPPSNDVVYVGTNNQGQQRVLLNVGSSSTRVSKDTNPTTCKAAAAAASPATLSPLHSSLPHHPTRSWRNC